MENKEVETYEVRDEVLDLARNEMKQNILKRKKILARRKIFLQSGIVVMLLAILIIPIVISSMKGGTSPSDSYFKPANDIYLYESLSKENCESIELLNKDKKQSFYWFKPGTRIETFQYTFGKDVVMVEEVYTYEDLTINVYITQTSTELINFEMTNDFHQYDYNLEKDISIVSSETHCYVYFDKIYRYYVKIDSPSQETMVDIIDLLRS